MRIDTAPPTEEAAEKQQESFDGVFRVKGTEPRVFVRALAPLAHYKVALHARGVNEDETRDSDLKTLFEEACLLFARKAAGAVVRSSSEPAPHPNALDPHVAGVELVSRVWYPFSDCHGYDDRFAPTGRQMESFSGIDKLGFLDLFIEGQRLADATQVLLDKDGHDPYRKVMMAMVVGLPGLPSLPTRPADWGKPVIYPGVRNRLECRGVWADSARPVIRWKDNIDLASFGTVTPEGQHAPDGRETWSTALVVFNESKSQIGGEVDLSKSTALGKIMASYAGLAEPLMERVLLPPPVAGGSAQKDAPARGTVIAWRRHAFKSSSSLSGNHEDAYRRFVARLTGTPVEKVNLIAGLQPDRQSLEITLSPLAGGKFVAPAFSLPGPVSLTLTKEGITAKIGTEAGERRLPFVDDDISYIIRLTWQIPLLASHLERPRDLAAIKEFQLYRTKRGEIPKDGEPPRAVLPRPIDGVFRLHDHAASHPVAINLDEVEWTWLDAVEDRDAHEFDYHVIAVPEHIESYASQPWFRFPVTVPCSNLEARPERVVPLPLVSSSSMKRELATYLPQCEDRGRLAGGRLAWRLAAVASDPLVEPRGSAQHWPIASPFEPKAPAEIFPAEATPPLEDFSLPEKPYPIDAEGWSWAEEAVTDDVASLPRKHRNRAGVSCEAPDVVHPVKLLQFTPETHKTVFDRNGPFFKLHLQVYLGNRFPRLRHTLATETLETNWLQCYPEPLPALLFEDQAVLLRRSLVPGTQLRYRFHVFVAAITGEMSSAFQLASYYRIAPRLAPDTLQDMLSNKLSTLVGSALLDRLRLFVTAEEGIALDSYGLAEDGSATDAPSWFVALRSSEQSLELRAHREAGAWRITQPRGTN